MSSPGCALRLSCVLFGLVGLGHLVRILVGVTVVVGGYPIGRRWSALAIIVLAALCAWLWRMAKVADKKEEPAPPVAPSARPGA